MLSISPTACAKRGCQKIEADGATAYGRGSNRAWLCRFPRCAQRGGALDRCRAPNATMARSMTVWVCRPRTRKPYAVLLTPPAERQRPLNHARDVLAPGLMPEVEAERGVDHVIHGGPVQPRERQRAGERMGGQSAGRSRDFGLVREGPRRGENSRSRANLHGSTGTAPVNH
jgi:hypothetical protein